MRPGYTLVALVLLALVVRVPLAPGSAGSDIPQFLGFARSIEPGLCMYQYSVPVGEPWAYPWPYPYGPLFSFILYVVHEAVCPCSLEAGMEGEVYRVIVDWRWALALKLVFIVFDVLIVVFIYKLLEPRGRRKATLAAGLYAIAPMPVYVTSIYGMFDSIPTALFIAGLAHSRKSRVASGFLMGLAAGAKQTHALPALMASIALGPPALASALLALGLSTLPFLLCPTTTAFYALASRIALPGPVEPIVYSFNGLSSLATLLYKQGETSALILVEAWPLPFTALSILAAYYAYKSRDPVSSALVGYAAFAAAYWRVNPQYMLTLTALGLAALPVLSTRLRPPLAVALVSANLWPLLYPIEFWYMVHIETPGPAAPLVAAITLDVYSEPVYVILALSITLSLYVLVILGAASCRKGTCS